MPVIPTIPCEIDECYSIASTYTPVTRSGVMVSLTRSGRADTVLTVCKDHRNDLMNGIALYHTNNKKEEATMDVIYVCNDDHYEDIKENANEDDPIYDGVGVVIDNTKPCGICAARYNDPYHNKENNNMPENNNPESMPTYLETCPCDPGDGSPVYHCICNGTEIQFIKGVMTTLDGRIISTETRPESLTEALRQQQEQPELFGIVKGDVTIHQPGEGALANAELVYHTTNNKESNNMNICGAPTKKGTPCKVPNCGIKTHLEWHAEEAQRIAYEESKAASEYKDIDFDKEYSMKNALIAFQGQPFDTIKTGTAGRILIERCNHHDCQASHMEDVTEMRREVCCGVENCSHYYAVLCLHHVPRFIPKATPVKGRYRTDEEKARYLGGGDRFVNKTNVRTIPNPYAR